MAMPHLRCARLTRVYRPRHKLCIALCGLGIALFLLIECTASWASVSDALHTTKLPQRISAYTQSSRPLWYSQVVWQTSLLASAFRLSSRAWNSGGPAPAQLLLPPKAALMFLTPGQIGFEPLWREWLGQAGGLIPKQHIDFLYSMTPSFGQARANVLHLQQHVETILADSLASPVDKQLLFTIYVHWHPNYTEPNDENLFIPHVIPKLIVARRMHHSLMEATKLLLQAALEDPLNQNFVLLSESHVPLYPPTTVYLQLLHEQVSRMDACHYYPLRVKDNLDRWRPGMCRRKHWRKSFQWFSATRLHAELIANNEELFAGFARFCRPHMNQKLRRFVSCSDNEHLPAVIISSHRQGHATTCWPGGTTFVDWSIVNHEGRPRTFSRIEVTTQLFERARISECDFSRCKPECATQEAIDEAIALTARSFVHVSGLGGCCDEVPAYKALSSRCPLFARKFKTDSLSQLQHVLAPFLYHPQPAPRNTSWWPFGS